MYIVYIYICIDVWVVYGTHGMDGVAASQHIRARPHWRVPTLESTALPDPPHSHQNAVSEATSHLTQTVCTEAYPSTGHQSCRLDRSLGTWLHTGSRRGCPCLIIKDADMDAQPNCKFDVCSLLARCRALPENDYVYTVSIISGMLFFIAFV